MRKIQLLLYLQPIIKIKKLHKVLVKTYKYKWTTFTLFLKMFSSLFFFFSISVISEISDVCALFHIANLLLTKPAIRKTLIHVSQPQFSQ